jgi:hypothetical protein
LLFGCGFLHCDNHKLAVDIQTQARLVMPKTWFSR